MLANTPCPINDARTGKLLMGRNAIKKYREDPATFVVGYDLDKKFWDTLLQVGEEHDEAFVEVTTTKRSLSDQFRSSKRRSDTGSGTRTTSTGNRDGGSKPDNDRSGED